MTTQTANVVRTIDDYYNDPAGDGRFYQAARKLTTDHKGSQMTRNDDRSDKFDAHYKPFFVTLDTPLHEAMEAFLRAFAPNSAETTITTYYTGMGRFRKWATEEKKIEKLTVRDFEPGLLGEYLDYQTNRPPMRHSICHAGSNKPARVSNNTIRGAFHPLIAIGKWLVKKQVLHRNPCDAIDLPSKDNSGERPVGNDGDLIKLLEAVLQDPDRKQRLLHFAIIMLIANSMMRVSEVSKASIFDLDLDPEQLRILSDSKGRKLKKKSEYFFNEATAQAIRDWLEIRPDHQDGRLFCHGPVRIISEEYIRITIARYAKQAGVDANGLMPHGLKHLGGRRLAQNQQELSTIAARMNHTKITTTLLHYLRPLPESVKASRQIGIQVGVIAPIPPVVAPEPAPKSAPEPAPQIEPSPQPAEEERRPVLRRRNVEKNVRTHNRRRSNYVEEKRRP